MTQKPLMLKDFLELDANSESRLELRPAPRRISESGIRKRSQGAALMARVSAAISAVKIFSSSSTCPRRRDRGWFLTRSFSKRLRRSFWRRSGTEEIERVRVRDIVRLRSFQDEVDDRGSLYFPSPIVSSCSSSSEDGETSGSDFVLSSCGSSEWSGDNEAAAAGAGKTDSTKKDLERDEKEEEQLSPVSVMEFPCQEEEDDDGGENSTTPRCFDQKLAHIERTRQQLMLHKIQRFDCLAELEPVNLDARFDDTLDSCYHVGAVQNPREKKAIDLLRQLESEWGPQCGSIEKLLGDFFEEGLSLSCLSLRRRRRLSVEEELVKAAGDWITGAADDDGEAELKEVERDGGWGCLEAENEGLAVDLAGRVLSSLMVELVLDLASC